MKQTTASARRVTRKASTPAAIPAAAPTTATPAPADEGMLPVAAGRWGPRASALRDANPRTLAGQTALRLRQDIIRNEFSAGERLTNEKLAERYGVGTSPLREALFQVAGEGLVRVEDHKGFVVAPLSREEMLDVSSLRAYLEIHALRQSIASGDEEWETAVLVADHRLKSADARLLQATPDNLKAAKDEWERRHRDFHYALCSACGSPWLLHFFDTLYDQLERYRRHLWRYGERARGADDQHDEIRQAALARDADAATALLAEHFRRQAELTIAEDPQLTQRGSAGAARLPLARSTGAAKPESALVAKRVNGARRRAA